MLGRLLFLSYIISDSLGRLQRSRQPIQPISLLSLQESNSQTLPFQESMFYTVNLTNLQSETFSLIIDLSSSWLLLTQNPSNSSCLNSEKNASFLENEINGILCTGSFIVDSIESTQQNFVLIEENEIFNGFDGVLGLGFSKLSEGYLNIIENLLLEEAIGNAIFSLNLADGDDSFITIGEYLDDYEDEDTKSIKIIAHEGHWLTDVDSIQIDSLDYSIQKSGYFDLTLNVISLPIADFSVVRDVFLTDSQCSYTDYISCQCTSGNYSSFPNITLVLNSLSFIITPQSYFQYTEENNCMVSIIPNNLDYWKIGIPFFKERYLVFDMENHFIYVYQAIDLSEAFDFNIFYIIGFLVLAVIVVVPLCLYCCLSKIKSVQMPDDYNKLA